MLLQMALFLLFVAELCSIVFIYHVFFIYSSADGHLGYFHVLAIINSAAVNSEVNVSIQVMFFSECVPSGGITGSHGSSGFSFLGNRHTGFQSSCSNLPSHYPWRWVPFPPHPLQHLLFVGFLINGCSDWCGVIPHCIIVLLCTSNN